MNAATMDEQRRADWQAKVSTDPRFLLGDFHDCEHAEAEMRAALAQDFRETFGEAA
jgi:hypothetical protein